MRASYALFMNGSHFACEVLQALRQEGFPPDLLVLPEFPPATVATPALIGVPPGVSLQQPLLRLAGDIEITYAPQTRQAQCAERLRQSEFDFLLVACWPYLIGQDIVDSVRHLALNLHPSMLPAYRGPDPVGEQLACGEAHPGVSLHRLSPLFDQGDILCQSRLPESVPATDRASLERACAIAGSRLFIDALCGYDASWPLTPQGESGQGKDNQTG